MNLNFFSNLVTIAGGKWTTYRSMAYETIDKVVEINNFEVGPSETDGLFLEGGHTWTPTTFIRLAQDLGVDTAGGGISQLAILP